MAVVDYKNAVEYNGTIPEKFNLETSSHKVFAEYGNVGTEFDYISKKGFWVNASYQWFANFE
jgi:alpha,alpha-trehalase